MSLPGGRKLLARVERAVDWSDGQIMRIHDSLSPGHRQTAGLAILLAVVVFFCGAPLRVINSHGPIDGLRAGISGGRASARVVEPPPSNEVTGGASSPSGVVIPSPSPLLSTPDLTPSPTSLYWPFPQPVAPSPLRPVSAPIRVVAVVTTGNGTVPGRDDAAIAAPFLSRAGFALTAVTDGGSTDTGACQRIERAGDTVVAGGLGLRPELRSCLLRAGSTIIDFDPLGDVHPSPGPSASDATAGQVVSTRRGLAATLVDLGSWGVAHRRLRGRVGIVGGSDGRSDIEAASDQLRARGVDVAAVAFIRGDTAANTAIDVSRGVLDFSARGIRTVVFAAPVAVQSQWVSQAAVVLPNVAYLVSDAFDGVVHESYPPSFDGAIAYTSLAFPWFSRGAPTPLQAACQAVWQSSTSPPVTLASETVDVYGWCENVGLLARGFRTAAAGVKTLSAALRSQSLVSPLTSELGPLPGGDYGPTEDAALIWRASCGCWQQLAGFSPRPDGAGDPAG
ncbi:MAG: hypothetical protein ACYDAD_00790 [Acidimicrobiales bacterium]